MKDIITYIKESVDIIEDFYNKNKNKFEKPEYNGTGKISIYTNDDNIVKKLKDHWNNKKEIETNIISIIDKYNLTFKFEPVDYIDGEDVINLISDNKSIGAIYFRGIDSESYVKLWIYIKDASFENKIKEIFVKYINLVIK